MTHSYPPPDAPRHTSGTDYDDDDRDDEHAAENEASIREIDETTEAPEEFKVDDEDEPVRPDDESNGARDTERDMEDPGR